MSESVFVLIGDEFFSGEVFAADEVSLLSFAGSAGFGVGED